MNSKALRYAASSIVLGTTMIGCKPTADLYRPAAVSAKAARADHQAAKFYQSAQVTLAKGNLPEALSAMEKAVELSPRDAGYRMGLAELYMKSGRFVSAETTLQDVLALNPTDGRAGISLALARLAQGRHGAAVEQLRSLEGMVGASDLGLAYALAGETGRALELLEPAARAQDSNGRVRQNLALAYAFAGDWQKARVTAAQDVSPSQLNNRLAHWATIADPSAVPMRVANVLGVKPVADSGQPTRLALAPEVPASLANAEPVQTAAIDIAPAVAEPATTSQIETNLRTELAQTTVPEAAPAVTVASAPVVAEPAAVVVPTAAQAPLTQPIYAEAAASLVKPVQAPGASEARMEPIRAYVAQRFDAPKLETTRKPGQGRYVVQLGAYSSPANVEKAWTRAVKTYGAAIANEPLSTTIKSGGGRTLYRLSMAGFTTHQTANRACQSIRAKGGACFVRTIAGDSPLQWAARTGRRG